jgi:hypothetical protein
MTDGETYLERLLDMDLDRDLDKDLLYRLYGEGDGEGEAEYLQNENRMHKPNCKNTSYLNSNT